MNFLKTATASAGWWGIEWVAALWAIAVVRLCVRLVPMAHTCRPVVGLQQVHSQKRLNQGRDEKK